MNVSFFCLYLALTVASAEALANEVMTIFDFTDEKTVEQWTSVDDTVMGGRSSSRLAATGEGTVAFAGNVSLANNGGFASVRSRPREMGLGGYAGLVLRVRGDGRNYKVNLKHDPRMDGVLYRAAFDTARDEWRTVWLRFDQFVPTFRGRVLRGVEPLDPARVVSVGLMISDKQAGPFRLELARIEAFAD